MNFIATHIRVNFTIFLLYLQMVNFTLHSHYVIVLALGDSGLSANLIINYLIENIVYDEVHYYGVPYVLYSI